MAGGTPITCQTGRRECPTAMPLKVPITGLARRVLRRFVAVPEAKPCALPVDGWPGDDKYTWDDWDREMRAKYPVRHFLGERLPCYLQRTKRVVWEDPTY